MVFHCGDEEDAREQHDVGGHVQVLSLSEGLHPYGDDAGKLVRVFELVSLVQQWIFLSGALCELILPTAIHSLAEHKSFRTAGATVRKSATTLSGVGVVTAIAVPSES